MLQTQIGIGYTGDDLKRYLSDNCDRKESISYLKPFEPHELDEMKDNLATVSININALEIEKKEVVAGITAELKVQNTKRKDLLTKLRDKAENVEENCYVFFDYDNKTVGYYNEKGTLVSSRVMKPGEFQRNIFSDVHRNEKESVSDKRAVNE